MIVRATIRTAIDSELSRIAETSAHSAQTVQWQPRDAAEDPGFRELTGSMAKLGVGDSRFVHQIALVSGILGHSEAIDA